MILFGDRLIDGLLTFRGWMSMRLHYLKHHFVT